MNRKREKERERERARLLAEIADAVGRPLTPKEKDRIARFTADDLLQAWTSQSVDARQGRITYRLLAELLASSGITDYEPGMPPPEPTEDGLEFFVVSRSRGRVSIGTLPYRLVRAEHAEVLPLGRRQAATVASEALEARTAHRVKRAAELTAEHIAAREIGRRIASEEGERVAFEEATVKAWRRAAKKLRS